MAAANLPSPPDVQSTEAWAGAGRVIRAGASEVASWCLPPEQKVALTSCGVPLLEGVVDEVLFEAEPRDGGYFLARLGQPGCIYLAEPETGVVSELESSGGHIRFVNSSINHWLCSLYLVGTWFSSLTATQTWGEDAMMEHIALAELADLLQQITDLDPPAYGDVGDHETHFWPAVIDRWLY